MKHHTVRPFPSFVLALAAVSALALTGSGIPDAPGSATAAADRPTGLDGVWRTGGYGTALVVEGRALRTYDTTRVSCAPGSMRGEQTGEEGSDGRGSYGVKGSGQVTVKPEGSHRARLRIASSAGLPHTAPHLRAAGVLHGEAGQSPARGLRRLPADLRGELSVLRGEGRRLECGPRPIPPAGHPDRVRPHGGPVFSGPVAVLTSRLTVSSGESFAQALLGRSPSPARVGGNTQGVFSDTLERSLPNGWSFVLPNEESRTRHGQTFDGAGIPPQHPTPVFTEEEFAHHRDSALQRARTLLRGH